MIKRVHLFYRDNKLVIVGPAVELLELLALLLDSTNIVGKTRHVCYRAFERVGDTK